MIPPVVAKGSVEWYLFLMIDCLRSSNGGNGGGRDGKGGCGLLGGLGLEVTVLAFLICDVAAGIGAGVASLVEGAESSEITRNLLLLTLSVVSTSDVSIGLALCFSCCSRSCSCGVILRVTFIEGFAESEVSVNGASVVGFLLISLTAKVGVVISAGRSSSSSSSSSVTEALFGVSKPWFLSSEACSNSCVFCEIEGTGVAECGSKFMILDIVSI
ncbi:hypothetical protein WICPIJ_006433 [Wickerhamomyces pijperi]|uniref:Uncharacterized protein n=1 Tax=Wickerhamomyces pijperi TaxID=599730 RepID=A0A9P8Q1P3_WICPI|nr:hypothetical protein WICPIJ_006433 [Wickerhamomyces pijperi]